MDYRLLGALGFKVPALCLGTGTFGGGDAFFRAWGTTDVAEATRMVDVCLDAGVTMFDTADVYSAGRSEEILGQAIKGRRDRVIISTKATFRAGTGPNDVGSSRFALIKAVDASLCWALNAEQIARLDQASKRPLPHPYWHQADFAERNPFPV